MKTPILLIVVALAFACSSESSKPPLNVEGGESALTEYSKSLPLDKLKLPEGFTIEVYAEVDGARSMIMSPSGVLFVGNKKAEGNVYAIVDTDGDHKADKRWTVDTKMNMPLGVAFKDGDLYVAEVNRILKYASIETSLQTPPEPVVINDSYPTETHHGGKYIAFGPDGKLYVPVGAPCNICEPEEIFATITRMNADGTEREIFAKGIRNTVGFTWHPTTKEMWFTDNGRDMMGDDVPFCELNLAPKAGMHFGYPYCHQGDVADPEFGDKHPCSDFTPPVDKLGPHVAPLGVKFYTGKMFPEKYQSNIFLAEHGSWNRTKKIGYNVTFVTLDGTDKVSGHEEFISGWLDEEAQEAWGRPADVLLLDDGSLLISDDKANVIYRVSYKK